MNASGFFFRHWNCIGHHSRVSESGSYLAFDFMGVPLIVVRGADHEIRAFVNSCPHRGSQIVEQGEGACTRLQCPYHNWTFALDGSLYATPMFEESAVFKKADHGLRRIRLELWAGLMWINFNPDGPSLLDHLGDLPDRTAPWKAGEMVCVGRKTYPVKANWKLYLENFSDGYHVPFVHKTTLNRKQVSRRDFHDPAVNIGNYLMHYTRFEGTRGAMDGGKVLPELDLPPEDKTGTFFPSVHANCMMGFAIELGVGHRGLSGGAGAHHFGHLVPGPENDRPIAGLRGYPGAIPGELRGRTGRGRACRRAAAARFALGHPRPRPLHPAGSPGA